MSDRGKIDFEKWFNSGERKPYEPKDYSLPSDEYCELYNTFKTTQLVEKEQLLVETIAKIPRVNAKNYDVDFSGRQYESLYIEKCINEHLEQNLRQPTINLPKIFTALL